MSRKITHVIYHKDCNDGFMSAYLFYRLGKNNYQFHACTYGDPFPADIKNGEVFIVDFSFPPEVIEQKSKELDKIHVWDHHESARKNFEPLMGKDDLKLDLIFDTSRSGAGITWDQLRNREYFSEALGGFKPMEYSETLARMVRLVQDRDLWQFKYVETNAFYFFANCFPKEFEAWEEIERMIHLDKDWWIIGDGARRYQERIIEKMAVSTPFKLMKDGRMNRINGIPLINCSRDFGSDACHAYLKKNPDMNIVGYFYFNEKDEVVVRLRSRAGVDASAIAVTFLGGGGHKEACGFALPVPTFYGSVI